MATTERLRPPVDFDALASWIYERGLGQAQSPTCASSVAGHSTSCCGSTCRGFRDEALEKLKGKS
jgi:GH24 family phage-related lysozyme (muramidase)